MAPRTLRLTSLFSVGPVMLLIAAWLTSAAANAGQTVITYATWGGPGEIAMWERDIAAFEQDNPDIKVNLLISAWNQYWERAPFYLSGEVEVDVMQIGGQHLPTYAAQNLLLPLDKYVEGGILDLEPYFPSVLEGARYNGTLFGFPDTFSPYVLYFNIDKFRDYGLEHPYNLYLRDAWTWDAFEQIANQLTLDTNGDGQIDQWGHGIFSLVDNYIVQAMILSNGGPIYDPNFEQILFNDPKSHAALEWLAKVGQGRGDWNGWYTGRVAMMAGWPSSQRLFPGRVGFEVGVAPLPRPADGQHASVMTTNIMSIPRVSQHPDAAMRFINYMVGSEVQTRRIADSFIVSTQIDVALETLRDEQLIAQFNSVIADIADATLPWAVPPVTWEQVNAVIDAEFQKVDRGEQPVASAVERISDVVNMLLGED